LSPTFTLTSYQQAASNGAAITTQITPYTNMAAARIDAQINASTPLNNTLVSNANSEVSQLVGVNINTTQPVDINNPAAVAAASADALQYAAFNAGIGNVAFANTGGFEAGITAAATSFADGQFTSTDPITIGSLVTAVTTEANARTTTGLNTAALTATLASITANTIGETYNPEPTLAATQAATATAAVEQAKALVSQTRTWGTQIKALQTPATAFKLDVDTARAVLNSNSFSLSSVFGKVLSDALLKVQTESASPAGLLLWQSYTFPISYWEGGVLVSGGGTLTAEDNNGTLQLRFTATISGISTSGTIMISSRRAPPSSPPNVLDITGMTMSVSGGSSMTTPSIAFFNINNAAVDIAFKSAGVFNTANDVASTSLDGDAILQANGVSFNGNAKFIMVANNVASPVTPLSLSEISLIGTFTTSQGSSANASASVKFNNAATFDTIGLLTLRPTMWLSQNLPGDPFGMAAKFATATGGDTLQWGNYDQLSNQTCGQGVAVQYQCVAGDPYGVVAATTADISKKYNNPIPTSVQNVRGYYDINYGTSYYAWVTYPDFESASNYAKATFTISSQVALAGNQPATLTITANRKAYGNAASPFVGDVVAILAYNGQSIKLAASNASATPAIGAGTLTITNPSGVKLVISGTSNSITGTASVNNILVGTIDSNGGIPMIHYNDGSFEALQ
jgi:hypothetical protein